MSKQDASPSGEPAGGESGDKPTVWDLQQEVAELRVEKNALESRVEALHRQVDHLKQQQFGPGQESRWDRYDREVIERLEVGETYRPLAVRRLYERAGVKNGTKTKDRAKTLMRSELFDGDTFTADSDILAQ